MNPPLVFLSGPFSANGESTIESNIAEATKAAVWCLQHNVPFLCPNLLGAFPSFAMVPYDTFLNYALNYLLPQSKILVLLPGWRVSVGCQREYDRAHTLGIQTIEWKAFQMMVRTGAF